MNLKTAIIDTHTHFGIDRNKIFEKNTGVKKKRGQLLLRDMQILKSKVGFEKSLIDENNSLDEFVRIMDRNNIVQAWIHQLSFEHDLGYEILSNEDIADAIEKYPGRFRGFAGVNPYSNDALSELKYAINDLKLEGFKVNPNDYGGYKLNDKKLMYPLYEECCANNIPVSIHTGITPGRIYRMKNNYPLLVDDIAVDFPELTIIVEHIGFPWDDLCLSMVQRHPNMYVTITAVSNILIHNSPNQFLILVNKMLSMLGSKKILWGSDWTATPNIEEVISYILKLKVPFPVRKMMGIKQIGTSEKKDILFNNANRIFS